MKKPQNIRVVEYDRTGGVEVLELREHPVPEPGDGQVLVEVIAAGINHIEAFIRAGREPEVRTPFPRRQGSDFAGIVVAIGPGVAGFRPGADVVGHVSAGAHATHVLVAADALVAKPKALAWEVAGSLYLAGVCALDTLDELRIGAGDTLVVSAAAGGVGSIETQLAKRAGATVIGTCGERNFDYLRQLGIKPVLYGPGIADRIRAVAPGGVTAFIDNFGQDGRALADELGVPSARYRSSEDRRQRELAALDDDPEARERSTRQLARIVTLAAEHAITVLISGFYPLDDIRGAFDDLEKLHARGKIVLGTRPVSPFRVLKARDVADARA